MVKIGVVQQSIPANDKSVNHQRSALAVRQLAEQGAQCVLLQELHSTSYFCQTEDTAVFDWAEPIPGNDSAFFGELAESLNIVLIVSLFERRAAGLFHNTAVVFDGSREIAGTYRKMHIPDDPGFYEKFYFTPGDLGFKPIPTRIGNLGVLVCWDQWYPEAARLMAMNGADLLFYPTAIGWDPADDIDEKKRQRDAWVTIQRAHAIANGLPVVVANRVGFEASPANDGSGIDFWGSSFVAGAQGEILCQAPTDAEHNMLVDIDFRRTDTVRRIWPYFRDRRIDAYEGIVKRWGN